MRKTLRIVIIALLCAASYTACQRASEEKKEGAQQLSEDSLNLSYQTLNDSLALRWEILAREEDQKLANMRRLLEEVSNFPVYNKARLDTLQRQLGQVYEMRIEPETLTSEKIDRYDSASSAIRNNIIDYVSQHPDVEKYPLATGLVDSLSSADQRILLHRVKYDNYARDYNQFLESNPEYVRNIDTTDLHRKRTLFQLSE